MPKKNLLPLLLMFLLYASISYAKSFEVGIVPIKDKIAIEEEAVFNITVKNNLNTREAFRIRNFDYPTWDIKTIPLSNPIIVAAEPNSHSIVQVYVRSLNTQKTPLGTYSVTAKINLQRTEETVDVPLTVAIISTQALIKGYIPNVKGALILPKVAEPGLPYQIKIILKNFNPIEYDNVLIKVRSSLISEDLNVNLGPAGEGSFLNPESEKTLFIDKIFDGLTRPQKDTIHMEVFYKNRLLDSQTSEFEIKEYVNKETGVEQKLALKKVKRLRLTSNNPDYKGTLESETSSFKKLFTSTSPKAELARKGERLYYVWRVDLNGNNSVEVAMTENFRPLVILIAITIISLALYFTFRSPIVVKKEVVRVHKMQGGISHLKVLIKVRNRGRKEISDVEVTDKIPSIAELEKDASIGSLKPIKLVKSGHSIVIKWKFEKLVNGDERVLSYTFRYRLPIVGEYSLTAASASCQSGKRHIVSNSNRAVVGG